jgi:two-component system phosphate regulon sensor histidine kinase PhoR
MTAISLKLKVPIIFAVISFVAFVLVLLLLGTNSIRQITLLQDSQLTLFISNHRFEFLDGGYPRLLNRLAEEPCLDHLAVVDKNWSVVAKASGSKGLSLSTTNLKDLRKAAIPESKISRVHSNKKTLIIFPLEIEALDLGYLVATSPEINLKTFLKITAHQIHKEFIFIFWGTCFLLIISSYFITGRIIRPIIEVIEYLEHYTHENPLSIKPLPIKRSVSMHKVKRIDNAPCKHYVDNNSNCWEQYFNVKSMAKRNPLTVPCLDCDVFNSRERDEMEKLKIFLNHLLSSIQFHYQRSKHYSSTLEETVSDRTKELQKRSIELQRETIKSHLIIDNIVEGMLVTDPLGNIIQMNNNAKKLLHINKTSGFDGSIMDLLHFDELKTSFDDILQEIRRAPHHLVRDVAFSSKNTDYFLAIKAAFVQDKKTSFDLIIYLIEDITAVKQLDQFRNDFFNTISHDLKNPLTSILGFLDLVLHGPENTALAERHRKLLNFALHSSEDLQRMITDLSDLVRLESNKIILNKFLFPVGDFFYELEIFFTPAISDKNISITKTVEPEELLISADFYRLKQVFMNLIANAIKLGDGIAVKLWAYDNDDKVIFIVEDNGPGIPKEKLPLIFEKYSRLHNYKNNADGLGLGLSIVKSIVGLHNGSITVESELGKGTRFIITLPKA